MEKDFPIRFKTPYLEKEFCDPRLNTALVMAVLYTAWLIFKYTNREAVVTGIFRTKEEQEKICRDQGVEFYESVHQFWRGADVRSIGIEQKIVEGIVRRVNLAFPYNGSPGKKTAIIHQVGSLGMHIHLQSGHSEPHYQPESTA